MLGEFREVGGEPGRGGMVEDKKSTVSNRVNCPKKLTKTKTELTTGLSNVSFISKAYGVGAVIIHFILKEATM